MSIPGIIIVDDCFDNTFREVVINVLKEHGVWSLCNDSYAQGIPVDNSYSDAGFLMHSYNEFNPETHNENKFNTIAALIFNGIMQKQKKYKFNNIAIKRFVWNYYNTSSIGITHTDDLRENHCSIVYYFNSCDAFTTIDDKRIENIAGRAVFFNSNILHRGTGLIRDKFKFILNIMFSYSDYELLT